MSKPKVGDTVTCRIAVEAYYSHYGTNPCMIFKPGMLGIVKSIATKVRIVNYGPQNDGKDEFLVVDYNCPITGKQQRVGLNFCNAIVVICNAIVVKNDI